VESVRPERQTVRRTVPAPGELQAFETTAIRAKISGYVKQWNVNIGATVEKGQVLTELSVPETEAELQQKRAVVDEAVAKQKQAAAAVKVAEANVVAAQAKITEVQAGIVRAESDVARWQAEYKRVEQLFRERAQTGTYLDETRNKLHSSEASVAEVHAQVKTADAGVVQSLAELEKARSDLVTATSAIEVAKSDARRMEALLGYTRIDAPFAGIITKRNVNTGDLTKPGADAEPLFVVDRSDIVTIRVDVPEAYATETKPGNRAQVKIQEMKGKIVEAVVTRTAWAVDPKTRTLRVELDVPNPEAKLRPGLYAYATIVVEEHKDVLTLPNTAIVKEPNRTFCVAIVDGKAARRTVEVGLSDGTRTEIVSGLDGTETVVKANAGSLIDRQPLEVGDPSNPAPAK
jgi:RND family efflux transporter MFP subunit